MGNRITRTGRITHTGVLPVYKYEDRDGVQTLVSLTHDVQMIVEIQDGPDAGREVRISLTTLEALFQTRTLELVRHEAHAKTKAMEALDAAETAEQDA